MFLSEKEQKIVDLLEKSEKKLNLTDIANKIESNLPYTSQLISKLEARSIVRIERKDNRSKYIILISEAERDANKTVRYKEDPQTLNFALKMASFFMAHLDEFPGELSEKLVKRLTPRDRNFIDRHSEQIEELEGSWEGIE